MAGFQTPSRPIQGARSVHPAGKDRCQRWPLPNTSSSFGGCDFDPHSGALFHPCWLAGWARSRCCESQPRRGWRTLSPRSRPPCFLIRSVDASAVDFLPQGRLQRRDPPHLLLGAQHANLGTALPLRHSGHRHRACFHTDFALHCKSTRPLAPTRSSQPGKTIHILEQSASRPHPRTSGARLYALALSPSPPRVSRQVGLQRSVHLAA